MKKIKNKIKNLVLIFFSSLFGLFLIEFFSLIALKIINSKTTSLEKDLISESSKNLQNEDDFQGLKFKTSKEFRLSRPLPYKESNYFNWFIQEQWTNNHPECDFNISHDGKGFNLTQKDTPNCRGFTIVNGWRITKNQPLFPKKNIYIFGGSTIQNREVPNNFTIASLLQSELNKKNLNYRVNNRGFSSVTVNQQNDFLRKEKIEKGDIVIYYDGGNNQWQGIFNNSPYGTIIASNRRNIFIFNLKKNLSIFKSYKLLSYLKNGKTNFKCPLTDEKEIFSRANIAFNVYKNEIIKAKNIANENDASFFHIMQPHLFSYDKNKLSTYEKELILNTPSEMIPCGASKLLTISSQVFSERHKEIIFEGVNSFDLSKIFEKRSNSNRKNIEYFLDWIHITEHGNKLLAEKFMKIILFSNSEF